jgi:hypothetical protein
MDNEESKSNDESKCDERVSVMRAQILIYIHRANKMQMSIKIATLTP